MPSTAGPWQRQVRRPRETRLSPAPPRPADTALQRAAREIGLPLTPAHQDHVVREELRMLLLHTRLGTLAATVFAVLLVLHLQASQPQALLWWWLSAKLAVAGGRIALAQACQLRQMGTPAAWRRATLALLTLDGAVWGLGGWAMMAQPIPLAALVVAALDGVSCVATFGLQVSMAATAAYTVPMLLPLALGLAMRPDGIAAFAAAGQLILLALQLFTAHGTSRRLLRGLLLQLQTQSLAQQKDAALREAHVQSQLQTQFLAKVSHELRTPLHGMLGLSRLLHLESADPTLTHRLELIEASGTHLLALINDLLDVSRIDSGRFSLQAAPFDLSAELAQVADVFTLRAADKGLCFEFDQQLPRPHWVMGDAARVRQVLHNLLGNAVKFTHQGSITLQARPGERPDTVRLTVSDTGDGISQAERQRIFQAFHQAPGAGGKPTEGVGLGLTIARELAAAMDGEIMLDSGAGPGASFSFTARLPACGPPGAVRAEGDHLASQRLPRLVLVAEDDEVNALIVGAFLESLGVRCERVPDGKQAVARALRETDRPDLVLMDYRMPVLDGPGATAEIRRQERTLGLPRLPILALTATSAQADRQACLDAGMDDIVTKPFTPEQLARAMRGAGPPRPPTAAAAPAPRAAAGPGARSRP